MALPQSGQWHRAYQDPFGVTVYQENDDGSVGLYGVHFADGTFQTTAAFGSSSSSVTPISVSGGISIPALTNVLVKASGGAGGITLTLPTSVGVAGQSATIKKVDATVGVVTIATTSAQTIDGASSYLLVNQWQYVTVESDGSNWLVVANN